jgi:hypothetical protein
MMRHLRLQTGSERDEPGWRSAACSALVGDMTSAFSGAGRVGIAELEMGYAGAVESGTPGTEGEGAVERGRG